MNTGIIVRDPTRTFNMIWNPPMLTWFNCSNYLLTRRELLVKKFYKRKLAINNMIVWVLTILAGVVFLALMLFLIYISGIWLVFNSLVTFVLGILLAELTLVVGVLIQDKLSDKFPLNTMFIRIEDRKKKK